jgi:hypothetical protein
MVVGLYSSVVLGLHTALELSAGALIGYQGHYRNAVPRQGALVAVSGPSKLFARWHACGLLAVGIAGALGLSYDASTPEGAAVRTVVLTICMCFHFLAGLAMVAATQDAEDDGGAMVMTWPSATLTNIHFYFGLLLLISLSSVPI